MTRWLSIDIEHRQHAIGGLACPCVRCTTRPAVDCSIAKSLVLSSILERHYGASGFPATPPPRPGLPDIPSPTGSADKAVRRGVRRREGQAHADASHRASQHVPNPMCVVPMRHGQVVSDATQPSPRRRGLVILESDAALAEMSRSASRLPPAGQGLPLGLITSWFRHRRYTSVSGRMGQVRV